MKDFEQRIEDMKKEILSEIRIVKRTKIVAFMRIG